MTKGIKTFRIYGNDVEMWLKQNNGDYTGKIIPGSAVYSVEYDEENLNCFKTLAEARKYAKEWYE